MAQVAEQVVVERAQPGDIPAIAALFTESFRDSVLHHCGKLPSPLAMEDVFSLVYEAEPAAALVARREGKLIGYCFCPCRLSQLWLRAVTGGYLLRWAWHWLSGQYGFGWHPVKVIVSNKVSFFRSALTPSKAADARILSIAVAAAARGQGVAGKLMDEALAYFAAQAVETVRLEVRPDNLPAVGLYERLGFVPGGRTRDTQGEWLIMYKEMRNLRCST